jgi:hypothetical protein
MSENCRFYVEKMRARRAALSGSLRSQWIELMAVVSRCEAIWALEERIERSL